MKIFKPQITVDEVFDSCLSNMREANKAKYRPCLPEIQSATQEYEKNMEAGTPQNVAQCGGVNGLSKDELEKLYTTKLSKLRQPARKYYDEIISLAPRGICPYCQQQIAYTLDHYYPKAHYTSLVITPTNLVPSCSNCNKNKSDIVITKKEEAILNPYFEDTDDFVWLKGTLIKDKTAYSITMSFSVCTPDGCDPVLRKRLEKQFALLHLNDLYSKHAAEDMIAVTNRHLRIFKADGANGVRDSIEESLQDNEYRPNSWQCAMYRALNDDWYLNEWLPQKAK